MSNEITADVQTDNNEPLPQRFIKRYDDVIHYFSEAEDTIVHSVHNVLTWLRSKLQASTTKFVLSLDDKTGLRFNFGLKDCDLSNQQLASLIVTPHEGFPEGIGNKVCIFENVNFSGASLRGANLDNCALINCNFEGADLRFATINPSEMTGCNFNNAIFTAGKFFERIASESSLTEKNTFKNTNIDGATIPDSVRTKINE